MKNRSTVCGIAKVLAEILRALDNTVLKTMALVQFPSPRAMGTASLPGLPRPQPDGRKARPRRRLPHRRWVSFPSSGDLDRSFQVCVQPSAEQAVQEAEKVDLGKPWRGTASSLLSQGPQSCIAPRLLSAHTAAIFLPVGPTGNLRDELTRVLVCWDFSSP